VLYFEYRDKVGDEVRRGGGRRRRTYLPEREDPLPDRDIRKAGDSLAQFAESADHRVGGYFDRGSRVLLADNGDGVAGDRLHFSGDVRDRHDDEHRVGCDRPVVPVDRAGDQDFLSDGDVGEHGILAILRNGGRGVYGNGEELVVFILIIAFLEAIDVDGERRAAHAFHFSRHAPRLVPATLAAMVKLETLGKFHERGIELKTVPQKPFLPFPAFRKRRAAS